MKKYFLTALSCVLLLSGCSENSSEELLSETEKTPLYVHGLDVVSLIGEKVHNENYITAYGVESLIDSDLYETLKNGDYSNADKIYSVTFSDNISELFDEINTDGMTEGLKKSLDTRIFETYANALTARTGTEALALSSLFNSECLFVDGATESRNLMCIYIYNEAYPIAVTFSYGDGGAVKASGTFILADDFKTDTEKDIEKSLSAVGIKSGAVDVTQIK